MFFRILIFLVSISAFDLIYFVGNPFCAEQILNSVRPSLAGLPTSKLQMKLNDENRTELSAGLELSDCFCAGLEVVNLHF